MTRNFSLSLAACALLAVFVAAQPFPQRKLRPLPQFERSDAQLLRMRGLTEIDKGNILVADSLMALADFAGALEPLDYIAWMPAKAALARYLDLGLLCCKAGAEVSGLSALACSRMYDIVKDKPIETRRLSLVTYKQCALSQPHCDSLRLKQWLSRCYQALGMFTEETDLLRELDTPHFPSARDFLSAARDILAMGLPADAVVPAMEAFRRCSASGEKSLAATIVYQCFVRLGKTADAALWLPRAQLSDIRFRAQAAGFLQQAGLLDKADSLILSLPSSTARDTLAVRQALFSGNPAHAAELAASIRGDRDASNLWRIRTSVFSGRADSLEEWIDTVSFHADAEYSREVLSYRYKLELLKDAPIAVADFGAVEYSIWRQRPSRAHLAHVSSVPVSVARMMVFDVVEALLDKGQIDEAASALANISTDDSVPEARFYRGDILVRQGSMNKGVQILQDLVISNPTDVFAIKAKSVLEQLGRK